MSLAQELTDGGRSDAAALARLVTTSYRDQKRRDAELLLEQLAGGIGPPPAERRVPKERLGRFGSALRNLDTEVERPTGTVLRQQIVLDAALHEADFDELQERALERVLVAHTAQQLGLRAHCRRARARAGALPGVPRAHGSLASRVARGQRHSTRSASRSCSWWTRVLPDAALVPEPSGFERNRRPVTDQLRREGRYPDAADRGAGRATLADGVDPGLTDLQGAARRLVNEQLALTDWRPSAPLGDWLEEHGFGSHVELLHALADAATARAKSAAGAASRGPACSETRSDRRFAAENVRGGDRGGSVSGRGLVYDEQHEARKEFVVGTQRAMPPRRRWRGSALTSRASGSRGSPTSPASTGSVSRSGARCDPTRRPSPSIPEGRDPVAAATQRRWRRWTPGRRGFRGRLRARDL